MRRLYYASGDVLISDVTCKALLRYARALAENGRYDVVSVPVYGEDEGAHAHLLVGPASELFAIPVPSGGQEDPADIDQVRLLEQRTRGLDPSRPEWHEEMGDVPEFEGEPRLRQ
jgi:hypothetical protein